MENRREFAIDLMKKYVPSQLGDDLFREITQGRAEQAAERKKFFSTCGELGMFLLHQLGYVGPLLNRTLYLQKDGESRGYVYGQNMAYLVRRGKQWGNFVKFDGTNRPKPGDIVYIAEATGAREHVFVFHEEEGTTWRSFDAGQLFGKEAWTQCARTRERVLEGKYVKGNQDKRLVFGWVDLDTLELRKDAKAGL